MSRLQWVNLFYVPAFVLGMGAVMVAANTFGLRGPGAETTLMIFLMVAWGVLMSISMRISPHARNVALAMPLVVVGVFLVGELLKRTIGQHMWMSVMFGMPIVWLAVMFAVGVNHRELTAAQKTQTV